MFKGKNKIQITDNAGTLHIKSTVRPSFFGIIAIVVFVVVILLYMFNTASDLSVFLFGVALIGIGLLIGLGIAWSVNRKGMFEVIIDRKQKTFQSRPDKLNLKFEEIKGIKVIPRTLSMSAIAVEITNGDRLLKGNIFEFDDASNIVQTIKNALG